MRPLRFHRDLLALRDRYADRIRSRFPDIPRRVSGFNLDRLLPEAGFDVAKALVGTEGTCVVVFGATVRLVEAKPSRTLVILGYPDVFEAGDHIPEIRDHRPVGIEGLDRKLIDFMERKGLHPGDADLPPEGDGFLLFEMLRADDLDGWRSDAVAESLDLCLACKGCRTDCPVNVDMATYKAEFLSHHHKRRLRPRVAYSMGLIYWWSRLASRAPRLVNAVSHAPGPSRLIKAGGGVARERDIPNFGNRTFVDWFRGRARLDGDRDGRIPHDGSPILVHGETPRYALPKYRASGDGHGGVRRTSDQNRLNPHGAEEPIATDRVMLWPDTFNNHLESEVLHAATEVLEDAGYLVEIPPRPLCCGRPLYDFGMLTTAKRLWRQTLETLQPVIRAGVPIVGVEPSCVAAFRDELVGLFPNDEDAQRLAGQTFILSEFLERQRYQPPSLPVSAIVHGHCHHDAVMGMDAEIAMLKRMDVDHRVLDSGCCGMAMGTSRSVGGRGDGPPGIRSSARPRGGVELALGGDPGRGDRFEMGRPIEEQERVVAFTHDRRHPVPEPVPTRVVDDADRPMTAAVGQPGPPAIVIEDEQGVAADPTVQEVLVGATGCGRHLHDPHR